MPSLKDLKPNETLFLICDLQARIRPAIHGFDNVVDTVNKMFQFAKLLEIPVITTTQNSKSLGAIDPAVDVASLGSLHVATVDKTLFSMLTPEVHNILHERNIKFVVLMGIEAHVCILQTAIDLLGSNLIPIVLSDATSSCNPREPPQARALLLSLGAAVMTSEAFCFMSIKDAASPVFKLFNKFLKETREDTNKALEVLVPIPPSSS